MVSTNTSFGSTPSGPWLARLQQSPQWRGGRFRNPQPMWNDMRGALLKMFMSTPGATPGGPVPVFQGGAAQLMEPPATGLRVTWLGHSSSLLEIDGTRVLADPMWSDRVSPVSWAGPKRFYAPPIALADLPAIDAVIISHDHYDHLDRATIQAMKDWKTRFVVPLGVGAHLVRWGIPEARITELDWWQSTRIGALELVATPSRHASGRVSLSDSTLWAGYALLGPRHRVYYSGDTGFFPGLREIGSRLGPFDVTLIESGQYDAHWPDWHLGPEQAVLAHRLVRGNVMIPVHWGLFKLAHHSWTEPVERVLAEARLQGVHVLTPRPGQSLEPALAPETPPWWPALPWRTAAEDPIIATRDGVASERFATGDLLPAH